MAKKILHIVSSPRKQQSVSNQLGQAIIDQINIKYPDSEVKVRDLTEDFPHYDALATSLRYTPSHLWTSDQTQVAAFTEELITELKEADILVIDSPMHNLGITSTLKAYFDYVVASGQTFRMTPQGVVGLLKNKVAYIAFSSGFIFSEGVYAPMDHNTTYLHDVLGFMGVEDVQVHRAEGMAYFGYAALERAINNIYIN